MNRLGVFEWQLEVWFELGVEQRFDLGMWVWSETWLDVVRCRRVE